MACIESQSIVVQLKTKKTIIILCMCLWRIIWRIQIHALYVNGVVGRDTRELCHFSFVVVWQNSSTIIQCLYFLFFKKPSVLVDIIDRSVLFHDQASHHEKQQFTSNQEHYQSVTFYCPATTKGPKWHFATFEGNYILVVALKACTWFLYTW